MNKVLTKPFEIVSLIKVISKEIEDHKAINIEKQSNTS
jgi:hypothetical protein